MMSREISEHFMPSVPIEMPSLTPIVCEDQTDQAGFVHAFADAAGQGVEVHVARVAVPTEAGDAHLGLVHVRVGQAGTIQHGLRSDLRANLGQPTAKAVEARLDHGPVGCALTHEIPPQGDVFVRMPIGAGRLQPMDYRGYVRSLLLNRKYSRESVSAVQLASMIFGAGPPPYSRYGLRRCWQSAPWWWPRWPSGCPEIRTL